MNIRFFFVLINNHAHFNLETVRLLMSMKIDRIKDDKISWSEMYGDPGTAQYHTLEDEVNYAVRCRVTTLPFSIQHLHDGSLAI